MSGFLRLFDATYRRAAKAAAAGDAMTAGRLYAEAKAFEEATRSFRVAVAQSRTLDEKLARLAEATEHLRPDSQSRLTIATLHARTFLESMAGRTESSLSPSERSALSAFAQDLADAGDGLLALEALALMQDRDAQAALFERTGDVERLEALLDDQAEEEKCQRALGKFIHDAEAQLASGDRAAARASLQDAAQFAPQNADVAKMLADLDRRAIRAQHVRLRVNQSTFECWGRATCIIGRDADISVRGATASREHVRLRLRDGRWWLADAGSRNGTLVAGYPIAHEITIESGLVFSLGESLSLRASWSESQCDALTLEIVHGAEQGRVIHCGAGPHPIAGARATLLIGADDVVLTPLGGPVVLNGVPVKMPIQLLREDVIEVDGTRIEVQP